MIPNFTFFVIPTSFLQLSKIEQTSLLLNSITLTISIIGIIGLLIAGIAWILLGKFRNDKLLICNGVLMITLVILSGVLMIYLFLTTFKYTTIEVKPENVIESGYLMNLVNLIILSVLITSIFFTWYIIHIISHFRASSVTGVKMFKYAGITHILIIIVSVIFVILITYFALSMLYTIKIPHVTGFEISLYRLPIQFISLIGILTISILVLNIISIIAYILSAIAFLSIKD